MRWIRLSVAVALLGALAACSPAPGSGATTTVAPDLTTSTSDSTTTSRPPTTTTTTSGNVDESILLVVGDWGSGTLPQGAVAGAMSRHASSQDVEAILTTGDNFYIDDWEFLMEPYQWAVDQGIPFWIAWGNHDVESQSRIDAINTAFDDPPRWTIHDWGVIKLILLDSNQITSLEQGAFFAQAMAADSTPTVVVMHHPPYSCVHQQSTIDFVDDIVDLLDDDVVLVLSGHEHVYQRFEREGTSFVVTGGGGSQLHELSDCPANHPPSLAAASLHHFLSMQQTADGLAVTAVDVNGETIDEFLVKLP